MVVNEGFLKLLNDENYIINLWTDSIIEPFVIKGHRVIEMDNEGNLKSLFSICKYKIDKKIDKVCQTYHDLTKVYSISVFKDYKEDNDDTTE